MLHSLLLILLLLPTFLTGCATAPSPDPTTGKIYPTKRIHGKIYRIIPAEDYLMRTQVPVPPAPNEKETAIRISIPSQRAWLYHNGMLTQTSPICTGKAGHETEPGTFQVISKHREWISTLYHVPMPYFLRLNSCGGKVGLHAGPIALQAASHGCIRLPRANAQTFFEETPIGTTVVITNY